MNLYQKKHKMCVFFIDLKSAYNTVDRKKLFNIIRAQNFLSLEESIFLEKLYNSIYYKSSSGTKHFLKNGVPQGSILSPLLFNIYMDKVIADVISKCNFTLFKKIYADDLVILLKLKHLRSFITIIREMFEKYNLIFNNSKSQIMIIRGDALEDYAD